MVILISLSESDKRVLVALLLTLIIVLVIIGYLVKLIKYIVKQQANYVDKSMYDILDANLVSDIKTFRKISWEKNLRQFYFSARIPMIVVIVLLFTSFLYFCVTRKNIFSSIGYYTSEASFILDWPTTKLFGINVISDWPTISKASVLYFNTFEAWFTYIFDIAATYATIHFLICTCALMARNFRTIKAGNEYFKKDLKDLKEAKLNAGQAHTQNPSEEMKEFVKGNETK